MSTPPTILPTPTPENAITVTMQYQQQLILVLNQIAKSLEAIAAHTEKIASKSH
jgi:hypothetical protein